MSLLDAPGSQQALSLWIGNEGKLTIFIYLELADDKNMLVLEGFFYPCMSYSVISVALI